MKMKRLWAFLLAVVLLLSLSACRGDSNDTLDENTSGTHESAGNSSEKTESTRNTDETNFSGSESTEATSAASGGNNSGSTNTSSGDNSGSTNTSSGNNSGSTNTSGGNDSGSTDNSSGNSSDNSTNSDNTPTGGGAQEETVTNKFAGKKLQIYGYSSKIYEGLDNMGEGDIVWMVRAAVDEWATLNGVKIEYVGGYDQVVIISDMKKGGKPDLLLYCNKFPLPALTDITSAFTKEEYNELAKTCGNHYLDLLTYKGQSYGVQYPWAGGSLTYYNKTLYERYGVKSPGEYFMEDNWTWDTFEKAGAEITRDIDGDGVIDVYGSSTYFWLIPMPMYRQLNNDGTLTSLVRNSEQFMKFLNIYYKAARETKAAGKYAHACISTSPRPAMSIGDAAWYNFNHMHRELVNGDIIEVIPTPKYNNSDSYYYNHTLTYAAILSSCDEREAVVSLLNYILQAGMRYMSDVSLGTYKCDYEGIRGASAYSLGWKQRHEVAVAEWQKAFNAFKEWDQAKYEKLLKVIQSAGTIHYINYTFPGEDGEAVKNYEQTAMPPVSSMPIIVNREEGWIQKFNEKYGK